MECPPVHLLLKGLLEGISGKKLGVRPPPPTPAGREMTREEFQELLGMSGLSVSPEVLDTVRTLQNTMPEVPPNG